MADFIPPTREELYSFLPSFRLVKAFEDLFLAAQSIGGIITLTGDVIGSGSGTIPTAIASNVILDANISSVAAISLTKLEAVAPNFALVSDGSGYVAASSVTNVELGYISGASSNIQAQINAISGAAITALTGDATATGPGSVALTLATVNGAPGGFGSSTQVAQVTVNGKGLVTAASSVTIDVGALINAAASKTTPVDADQLGLMDSAAANVLKKLSWANLKATLLAYFDLAGGSTGDVLTKSSGTDLDFTWAAPSSGGASRIFLAADDTNNNAVANTLQDLTGLSFSVVAGRRYKVKVAMFYTSAATTTGTRIVLDGPAMTSLAGDIRGAGATSGATLSFTVNGLNTPAGCFGNSYLTTGNLMVLEAIVIPSANGTVQARFASEVSSSAIVAKANVTYIEYEDVT